MEHSIFSDNFAKSKAMKKKNNGDNILHKINVNDVVNEFIKFYYTSFNTNPDNIINNIREFSTLKYSNQKYDGKKFYNKVCIFHKQQVRMLPKNVEFIDSGSRRIDISVTGVASDNKLSKNFSQTFLISHSKDGWYIKNSILIIS